MFNNTQKQYKPGSGWKDFIEKATDLLIDIIKVFTEEGGAIALAIIDVGVSGFVLQTVLGTDDVFGNAGKVIAFALSLAMSSLSIKLWRMIEDGTIKGGVRKWTRLAVAQLVIMLVLQIADLFIDLGVMELIKGSGDLMKFSFSSLSDKPTMWWVIAIVIGILTFSNEWLISILRSNRRKAEEKKVDNKQKQTNRPQQQRHQPRPLSPDKNGMTSRAYYQSLNNNTNKK